MDTLLTPKKAACMDWHKADIKAALEKSGYTLRGLSKLHGKSASYFREVLHRPNPKAEALVADVVGVSPSTIWPSRYEPDGTPRRGLYAKSGANGRDYLVRNNSLRASSKTAKVNVAAGN